MAKESSIPQLTEKKIWCFTLPSKIIQKVRKYNIAVHVFYVTKFRMMFCVSASTYYLAFINVL